MTMTSQKLCIQDEGGGRGGGKSSFMAQKKYVAVHIHA